MKISALVRPALILVAALTPFTAYLSGQGSKPTLGSLSEPAHQASIAGLIRNLGWRWDENYLVSWGTGNNWDASPDGPAVTVYDREGHVAREAVVWLKDARSVSIADAAVSRNGDLVVAGGTENNAGSIANFVASVGRDGHLSKIIRTSPFMPVYICAAEDGTVWSYGIDRDKDGRAIEGSSRLRQFSFEKGQIKSALGLIRRIGGWYSVGILARSVSAATRTSSFCITD